MREPSTKVPTVSCSYKGKRCTAIARNRVKFVYDAHSEQEAELTCEAVADRGYVTREFWREV